MATGTRDGFIIFGDLHKIGAYLDELCTRGLAPLVIAPSGASSLARRAASMLDATDHPFADIAEVSLRAGGDLSGIIDQVELWSRKYEITGLLVAAEVYVEAGAVLCDLLGLPGVGLRASRVCRNKWLQRRYLAAWSPASVLVAGARNSGAAVGKAESDQAFRAAQRACAELRDRFPVVVKPLTLESSIGVQLVTDEESLVRTIGELTADEELLVEERVTGREFNVDAIVIEGEPIATLITQKGTNEDETDFFCELIHTTPPTNVSETEAQAIADAHVAVIRRLAFETGMAHGEYRLAPDGRIVLMEIAARPPGDACLPLYELATGNAIEPVLIDAALGRPTDYSPVAHRRARQVYFEHTPGRLSDVRLDWPDVDGPRWLAETTAIWPTVSPSPRDAPAELRELLVLKRRGERLQPLTDSSTRAVTAIFDAPLDADIDAVEADVRDAVTISIDIEGDEDVQSDPTSAKGSRVMSLNGASAPRAYEGKA
jgi:hypothetical protein